MKNLKYVLFSFLLCFMFLDRANASASCVYETTYSNVKVTCNVTNSSVNCTSSISITSSGVSLKKDDFIINNVFVCPSNIYIYVNANEAKITSISATSGTNYDKLSLNKSASNDGSSATGSEEEPSTPPADEEIPITPDTDFNENTFCRTDNVLNVFRALGWLFFALKIIVPLIIIVFGCIDFGKAVIASKDDEIKSALKHLTVRTISGIIIFFVPTLVKFAVSAIGGEDIYNGTKFGPCTNCILDPNSCKGGK